MLVGGCISVTRCNTLISNCVNARQLGMAEMILRELVKVAENTDHAVADVVSFNTVMKGYSRQGNVAKCDELMSILETKGVSVDDVWGLCSSVRLCRYSLRL